MDDDQRCTVCCDEYGGSHCFRKCSHCPYCDSTCVLWLFSCVGLCQKPRILAPPKTRSKHVASFPLRLSRHGCNVLHLGTDRAAFGRCCHAFQSFADWSRAPKSMGPARTQSAWPDSITLPLTRWGGPDRKAHVSFWYASHLRRWHSGVGGGRGRPFVARHGKPKIGGSKGASNRDCRALFAGCDGGFRACNVGDGFTCSMGPGLDPGMGMDDHCWGLCGYCSADDDPCLCPRQRRARERIWLPKRGCKCTSWRVGLRCLADPPFGAWYVRRCIRRHPFARPDAAQQAPVGQHGLLRGSLVRSFTG